MRRWLYLSPHFDDVALSCGGLVASQAQRGDWVEVATVFAAGPASAEELTPFARWQHERWGDVELAHQHRREEDQAALASLGAHPLWWPFPDAIYRGQQYTSDDALVGPVQPDDAPLLTEIALAAAEAMRLPATVCLPLSAGCHVDHQLVASLAGQMVAWGGSVAFYEDFPYAARPGAVDEAIGRLGLLLVPEAIDVSQHLRAKIAAIACYASQIPVIFRHEGGTREAMAEAVRRYAEKVAGQPGQYAERLWWLRA
jgi:LmbE family N-acetylglucosaminyl deacetylase